MEDPNGSISHSERKPLSLVVSDCVERWFLDTFKQARAGDPVQMVLLAQMFNSGYGIAKNEQKGRAWLEKASRFRSSAWRVGTKRPGYNASDSDSDEENDGANQ